MPRQAHDFRGLTQPRRLRLLDSIQRNPGRAAGMLSAETGIPLNTVRDHLRVLQDEGLIRSETQHTGGRGSPAIVFHPVGAGASNHVAQARVEGASKRGRLLRAITREAPAILDDAALRQVDVLFEHLDDAGLSPVVDERELRFDLTPCRYHRLIEEDQELVCGVHERLVHDVLLHSAGPLVVKSLEPFVTAHACRLHLTFVTPSDGTETGNAQS